MNVDEFDETANDDIYRNDIEEIEKIKEIEKIIEKENHIPVNEDALKLNAELNMVRGNLFHTFTFLEHQIHNNVDDIEKIVDEIKSKIICILFLWEKVFDFKLIRQNYLSEYNDVNEAINKLIMHLNLYNSYCKNRESEDFNNWGNEYLRSRNYILSVIDRMIKYTK